MKKAKRYMPKSRVSINMDGLCKVLEAAYPKPCSLAYLQQRLRANSQGAKEAVRALVAKSVTDKRLHCTSKECYSLSPTGHKNTSYTGVIDHVRVSLAYVRCQGLDKDPILQGTRQLQGLFHGDKVRIGLLPTQNKKEQPRAYLIEALTRGQKEWIGQLKPLEQDFTFHADSNRLHRSFVVRHADALGAASQDKVVVKPLPIGQGRTTYAKVSTVLGKAGTHAVEMHSILRTFDIPTHFSAAVLQEAKQWTTGIDDVELRNRRDFRDVCCFTIDPEDAKDFDDALSFRELPDNCYEIGIHIADVSHYVRPGTELDKEAQARGTSVYLVDRVIPMLPEHLSNNLCSLRPEEDKLAFSAVLVLDAQAVLKKSWFGRTCIRSQHRFTYDEALACFQTGKGPFAKPLQELNRLAQCLRKRRFSAGSINLHSLEFAFELDENGYPLHVRPKLHHQAHELIEEFMLLANQKVTEHVQQQNNTPAHTPLFVYRAHEPPELAKLEKIALFARTFGYEVRFQQTDVHKELNNLLAKISGLPEEPLLQQLTIRSMSRAYYTTKSIGHFGLGFQYYTHFTSPIRRYPDLLVHRFLQNYLDKQPPAAEEAPAYEVLCGEVSDLERRATEAERASIKYKQAEYMVRHIGDSFQGIISGVTEWGFYVIMQPHCCEGMVKLSSLKDDYYKYDETLLTLVGTAHGKRLTLGDEVQVRVVNANPLQKQVDLALVSPQSTRPTTKRSLPDKS